MMFDIKRIKEAEHIRHTIHANPETKYEEYMTSALVADKLRTLGYTVIEGLAQTGVLAILDTNRAGPVIALRADMDALPIVEKTEKPYTSKNLGKMHACGHDGHTASLLLAASEIMARKSQLCGVIKLIFQPAEENGCGAAKMIEAGVLETPKVEAIYGYHNRPGFKTGLVFAKSGSAMGGNDTYRLTIIGKAGHAAMPHLAIDPIYLGSAVIMQLQGITARAKSPLQAGVITVSGFNSGGQADNAIPEAADLIINIRSDSLETREQLVGQLETLIAGVCAPFGATYQLTHTHHLPPLVNHSAETERVIQIAKRVLPDNHAVEKIDYMPTMGAEDFAFYLQVVPGCFFFVGNGEDSAYLHNDYYDFNDDILPIAATVFVGIVEDYCGIKEL